MTEINEKITLLERRIHELSEDNRNYLERLDERDEEIERLKKALQFYASEDNNLLVDGENTTVSIDGGRTARGALGGVSID